MDPRQDSDTGTGAGDPGRVEDHTGFRDRAGAEDPARSGDHAEIGESGRSAGADLLTMSLFGAMVIIASICFVIW